MCLSNLKQIGLALEMYAQDHDSVLPYHIITMGTSSSYLTYLGSLEPYARNGGIFQCPSRKDLTWDGPTDTTVSYAYNRDLNGIYRDLPADPSRVLAVMDGVQVSCSYSGGDTFRDVDGTEYTVDPNDGSSPNRVIFARHSGGGNGLFLDGHCKWLKPERVREHLLVSR